MLTNGPHEGEQLKAAYLAAAAAAAALALTSCVPLQDPTSTLAPQPTETPVVDDAEVIAPDEASTDARAAALERADEIMTAFARPDLDADEWYAELVPMLSQSGGFAYEGTDPATIAAHQVTGAGTILEGSTDVALIVSVPTDAGDYLVSLSRGSTDAPWLANRIRPANT